MIKRIVFSTFSSITLFFSTVTALQASPFTTINSLFQDIATQAQGLSPEVLTLGLKAYFQAKEQGLSNKDVLTIIDYSKPSTDKRLWVFDLKGKRLLFNTLVTHGKNSGEGLARHFSNQVQSLESSIGVFLTQSTYVGKHGYSLRIAGLEPGINDKALTRNIVFHPAYYASPDFLKTHGYLGRSWGCPALNPAVSQKVIDTIKEGSVVMAYYPDKQWIEKSSYLNV